jgi:ribosomal protein L7/L12
LPGTGVPQEVVARVQASDRMGAIRKYREATGAGMAQAQEAVAKL